MARLKSFSAERRQKQDKQGYVALAVLAVVFALALLWKLVAPYCWGALQAGWPPLLIIALRYTFRIVTGKRYDLVAVLQALCFLAALIAIPFCQFPKDIWDAAIILFCLIATVIGIKHFKFTPVFMLLNCLVIGAILLN